MHDIFIRDDGPTSKIIFARPQTRLYYYSIPLDIHLPLSISWTVAAIRMSPTTAEYTTPSGTAQGGTNPYGTTTTVTGTGGPRSGAQGTFTGAPEPEPQQPESGSGIGIGIGIVEEQRKYQSEPQYGGEPEITEEPVQTLETTTTSDNDVNVGGNASVGTGTGMKGGKLPFKEQVKAYAKVRSKKLFSYLPTSGRLIIFFPGD